VAFAENPEAYEGTYKCRVNLERHEFDDTLVFEYAICDLDTGEEVECGN
jgi:hypothetical protein